VDTTVLLIFGFVYLGMMLGEIPGLGLQIGWAEHARTGVPVTLVTLAIAAAWLWLRAP